MRFLVDAQLPKRFCVWLKTAGHDAIHTIDLPDGNGTTDKQVIKVAEREQRVVITKDDDFVQSYLINGQPSRLLLLATGNISNEELEVLLKTQRLSLLAPLRQPALSNWEEAPSRYMSEDAFAARQQIRTKRSSVPMGVRRHAVSVVLPLAKLLTPALTPNPLTRPTGHLSPSDGERGWG